MMHVYQFRFISALEPFSCTFCWCCCGGGAFFLTLCISNWACVCVYVCARTNPFKATLLERNLSCFECFWDMQYKTINNATNATNPLRWHSLYQHHTDFKLLISRIRVQLLLSALANARAIQCVFTKRKILNPESNIFTGIQRHSKRRIILETDGTISIFHGLLKY